jgi:hypothetical protein
LEILFYFSLFYTISPNLEEKPGWKKKKKKNWMGGWGAGVS